MIVRAKHYSESSMRISDRIPRINHRRLHSGSTNESSTGQTQDPTHSYISTEKYDTEGIWLMFAAISTAIASILAVKQSNKVKKISHEISAKDQQISEVSKKIIDLDNHVQKTNKAGKIIQNNYNDALLCTEDTIKAITDTVDLFEDLEETMKDFKLSSDNTENINELKDIIKARSNLMKNYIGDLTDIIHGIHQNMKNLFVP